MKPADQENFGDQYLLLENALEASSAIHRKLGGLFMLASRLTVSVNVHRLIMPWLQ